MNDTRTSPLRLDEPIATGSIKAAAKEAGASSGDLWKVPYDQIYCDPRDNIRPLDLEWAKHVGRLIAENGYDHSQPLHCYIRRVDGKNHYYVWKGQHRYHGIGFALKAGADIGLVPVVVADSKSVNRVDMIFGGLTSNESKRNSPLEVAEQIAELRDVHGIPIKTICERLSITDQTVRDLALLESAPADLHELVRQGTVTGTLAIKQIRTHGPEKALEQIQKGIANAQAAGKGKVTPKHLSAAPKPAKKISETQAKSLLQALQSVLRDPMFGMLSPGTIAGVHAALMPFGDLLDALPAKASKRKVSIPNEHGVYTRHETIKAPLFRRSGKHPYEIHLAHIDVGKWIFSTSYSIGNGSGSSPYALRNGDPTYPTRGQAIRAAVMDITRAMEDPRKRDSKEAPGIHSWLIKLWQAPDPDWTEELASEKAVGHTNSPRVLWPFPTGSAS